MWRSEARASPEVAVALVRLGTRIRAVRRERGLTQEAVASFAQLDPKHLQTIEKGRTNVTVASLMGIASALGVELVDLFEGV